MTAGRGTSSEVRANVDVIVVGGGAAGCVLAARLTEDPHRRVALVEAGPDYGAFAGPVTHPRADGPWPFDLLDAGRDATHTHDWHYDGGPSASRARVIGGCSSHNGCVFLWGSRPDYDEWVAATGDPGWGLDRLRPHLERATRLMRVHDSARRGLSPVMRTVIAAARELGSPDLPDYGDPDALEGVGLLPLNTRRQTRWNAAFAYLDPARRRPNLEILDRTLTARVLVENGRATGIAAVRDGAEILLRAPVVVLAAGAYGTPAVLQRSGVGAPDHLRTLGIPVTLAQPLVGAGLLDHPYIRVRFEARPALATANARHLARAPFPSYAQVKGRSSVCAPGTWDYTLPAWSGGMYDQAGRTEQDELGVNPIAMKTVSEGSVRIRSASPEDSPAIEHGYLTDAAGHDLAVMRDAVEHVRRIGRTRAWRRWSLGERAPGEHVRTTAGLDAWIRANVGGTYHPSATARMARDASGGVVDARGRVFGLDGLRVIDASVLPTIPVANIHASVLAIAERLAAEWTD